MNTTTTTPAPTDHHYSEWNDGDTALAVFMVLVFSICFCTCAWSCYRWNETDDADIARYENRVPNGRALMPRWRREEQYNPANIDIAQPLFVMPVADPSPYHELYSPQDDAAYAM
jgi:hypothetical protein